MYHSGALGRVKSLKFTRLSPWPTWSESSWIVKPELSGGALIDLHIHDADYVVALLGIPPAVQSVGNARLPGGPKVDYVLTEYLYPEVACVAEGGWDRPAKYPFEMAYEVNAEKGLLSFSTSQSPTLVFYPTEGEPYTPAFEAATGYVREMAYFCECIESGRQPERVTPFSARESIRVVLAERESVNRGGPVRL